ncbi:MAG TPA: hypothetical protein DEF51_31920, partial [Myxococcales bacterium]|nr:hypothetical protein [Myxococcales bacterium]
MVGQARRPRAAREPRLADRVVEVRERVALDPRDEPLVQPGVLEAMGRPVGLRALVLADEDRPPNPLAQRPLRPRPRPDDVLEEPRVEALPDRGGHRQDLDGGLAEPVEPPVQHVRHGVAQRGVVPHVPDAVLARERPVVQEVLQRRAEQERVARDLGQPPFDERPRQRPLRSAEQPLRQLERLVRPERRQLVQLELREARQRLARLQAGRYEQHALDPPLLCDGVRVVQHPQRGARRRVRVLEQDAPRLRVRSEARHQLLGETPRSAPGSLARSLARVRGPGLGLGGVAAGEALNQRGDGPERRRRPQRHRGRE